MRIKGTNRGKFSIASVPKAKHYIIFNTIVKSHFSFLILKDYLCTLIFRFNIFYNDKNNISGQFG